jgi:hypothetical protein
MTTTQKTLVAAMVVFACSAGFATYVLRQVKARSSSARVAVNAALPFPMERQTLLRGPAIAIALEEVLGTK